MFGKYKQSINNTLVSNYSNKKLFKKTFHSLMQGLKENKTAREFFVLYGEIENKKFEDKELAEAYLNEVIKTLKGKKKGLKIPTISEQKVLQKESVYGKLDSLIFNESVKSIEKNINNKRDLLNHLTTPKTSYKVDKAVPTTLLSNLATKKYNEKYNSLSEEDKTKLENLLKLSESEVKQKVEELKENTLKQLGTLKVAADKEDMKNKIQKVTESVTNSDDNILSIIKIENLNKSLIK